MRHRHVGLRDAAVPLFIGALCAAGPSTSRAVIAPQGFVIEDAFPGVPSTFLATKIVFLPDGRALVAGKRGQAWVVLQDGTLNVQPFINLGGEVVTQYHLGLTTLAIDPDFETEPWVYLLYTVTPGGESEHGPDTFSRVTRYRASDADPNVADPTTREVLIGTTWSDGIPSNSFSHTCGDLRFGEDGTLLVSAGDGAHSDGLDIGGRDLGFGPGMIDPKENSGAFRARSINSLAGKILRVDRHGHGLPSNPFWDGDATSGPSRVWLYGLRNVFRFCVRPGSGSAEPASGDPGTIYAADVGWQEFEELNIAPQGGMNFGWPCYEGPLPMPLYKQAPPPASGNHDVLCSRNMTPDNPVLETMPAAWWHHTEGEQSSPSGWVGASPIVGTFYEGTSYPAEYHGRFFMADYVAGWIRWMDLNEDDQVTDSGDFIFDVGPIVDLTQDPSTGDLIYLTYALDGELRRIRYEPPTTVGTPETSPTPSPGLTVAARPNPFTRAVAIAFGSPIQGTASVEIFDARGRLIRSLAERSVTAGPHEAHWDGRTDAGQESPAGVYFYRVRVAGHTAGGRVVLE